MQRLRRYPDSRIVAECPCLPADDATVTSGRLPAYSGATVPAFDRLPARKRERPKVLRAGRASSLLEPTRAVPAKVVPALAAFALAVLASACAAPTHAKGGSPHAPRIVTLMPSFAEDLCAIGAGPQIAAVSQFSQAAACARRAPAVANFASIDAEKIVSLHPDVVVAIPAQRMLTAALSRAGVATVFMRDESYADIFSNIRELGSISRRDAAASRLIARLQARTRALQATEHFSRRPNVFVVLQAQPIWTVGPQSYISTLLKMAGARNAVRQLPGSYAQFSPEALVALQPDAIVAGSDTQLPTLLSREPWRSLRAVREKHVFILSDPGVLERPGPRYNEGLSWLIERLRSLSQ
jgi:iron complex transport system substrate-binding protein